MRRAKRYRALLARHRKRKDRQRFGDKLREIRRAAREQARKSTTVAKPRTPAAASIVRSAR
ncbi:hypothetical protein JCM12856_26930 [Spirochaeta dissipatitropha]